MDTSTVDLTTTDGVLAYLSGTPFHSISATVLTGGFGNYTFRLHLEVPYQGNATAVLKHARPYVAAAKNLAFSLDRQTYEVAALSKVRERTPKGSFVGVPEVLLFDETAHVIIMSDCGENTVTLKQYLLESLLAPEVATKLGTALGEFIARLHSRGRAEPELVSFFDQNEEGKKMSAYATYNRLVSTLTDGRPEKLSDPPLDIPREDIQVIDRVAQERAQEMLTTKQTVLMGDFWPGNVLLSLSKKGEGEQSGEEIERVLVVDWEMVKMGLAGVDVGQFSAEIHLVRRFRQESEQAATSLLEAFLQAYRKECPVDSDLVRTALMHVGAHLIAWTPRVAWGGKEETREVVREGVGLILQGSDAQEDMKQSLLATLVK